MVEAPGWNATTIFELLSKHGLLKSAIITMVVMVVLGFVVWVLMLGVNG